MGFSKRVWAEEDGQGLAEYALIVFLVVLAFWVAIKDTNIGIQIAQVWANIASCLTGPFSCGA
jgi:Flp pilus assembly pilin Flp